MHSETSGNVFERCRPLVAARNARRGEQSRGIVSGARGTAASRLATKQPVVYAVKALFIFVRSKMTLPY